MTLEAIRDQLIEWSWRGKHADKGNLHVEIHRGDRPYVKLTLLTVTNSYGIRAYLPANGSVKGYFCCEFSAREPNPGETWTRGGDLADGDFSKETWDKIVQDILSVELAEAAERTEV